MMYVTLSMIIGNCNMYPINNSPACICTGNCVLLLKCTGFKTTLSSLEPSDALLGHMKI